MLYVGEVSNREQWHLLHSLPDFSHSLRYSQSNWAPLVLIPEWGACVHSRALWVSPTTSPVRLGVSPAAASTPIGFFFNQWFEALFPQLEPWVEWSVAGSTSCCLACQLQLCPPRSTICHLAGSASHHLAASPLHPAAHLHPSYQSG